MTDAEIMSKRLALANEDILEKTLGCCTIHCYMLVLSGDHPESFETIIREIVAIVNELIVIGGDWNVALNSKINTNHPNNVYRVRTRMFLTS